MPFFRLDRRGLTALGIFLLLALTLYLATLDNGLWWGELEGGDLITHQYAQVQARPSNAPGYPLYTMGGWLWFHGWRTLLPHVNPIPILASYSTLWAILALATLFILLYRLTKRNLVITAGISAFYAVTYFFWYYAVTTEQYTSAVLQTLLIVALVHAWDQDERDRYLYALAFLMGLALAHMVTVLFVAPGALLFLIMKRPALLKRGRLILKSILLALTPLIAYVYVYIRGAQHPEWWGAGHWANAWQWFLSFIATKQGQDEMTWTLGPISSKIPHLILSELPLILLLLGVVGWWLMGKRSLVLYGLTAVIYLLFTYIDRFGNWFQVILPLYPLVLVGVAFTLHRLWQRFPNRLWRAIITLALLGLIIFKFQAVYPRANQHTLTRDDGLTPGWLILEQNPPARAAIIGDVREKRALDYLTQIWGKRPDIVAISPEEAARALQQGRPLLVTTTVATFAIEKSGLPLRYTGWGPTLLLAGNGVLPALPTDDLDMVSADVGGDLSLVGYQIMPASPPNAWLVRLALQAKRPTESDLSLSVRLLAGDTEIAQQDHGAPASGFTPTSSLRAGETVFDNFRFELPPDAPAPDGIRFIFYRQLADGSFQNLAILDFPIQTP